MKTLTINLKANDVAEVLLYDEIGEDEFFGGGISAKTFREQIKGVKAKTINLRIQSMGGSMFEASAMMAALDEFKGRVDVDIDGIAASAASVVAMAGKEIRMAPTAMMMIHNPMASIMNGRADKLRSMADALDKARDIMLTAYERHSKVGRDRLGAWMDAEEWFKPQEAIAAGLAHSVSEGRAIAARADLETIIAKLGYKNVPESLTAPPARDPKVWAETDRLRQLAASL